jgi:hypothetical protein
LQFYIQGGSQQFAKSCNPSQKMVAKPAMEADLTLLTFDIFKPKAISLTIPARFMSG